MYTQTYLHINVKPYQMIRNLNKSLYDSIKNASCEKDTKNQFVLVYNLNFLILECIKLFQNCKIKVKCLQF